MSAPDHWKSLTHEKKMEMEKHARGLVQGSVIEGAASRFVAMCLAEAIGESKRRVGLCDPTQDERVKALVKAVRELREYAVILAEPKQLHAVDAALRALEQGEG